MKPWKLKASKAPTVAVTFRAVIREFWEGVTTTNRLARLMAFAERTVQTNQSYYQNRKTKLPMVRGQCWACRRRKAEHRHHVIQLQHGGTNSPRNLVAICRWCHGEIHPWMPVKTEKPIDEFRWLPK